MKELFEEIVSKITEVSAAKKVYGNWNTGFCPEMQWIRLDALNPENWPNNISDNSIFIEFKFDLAAKKLEVSRTGHIWLSPSDKATDRYKYLAMKSMTNVAEDMGKKKFRKSKFKNADDAVKKMNDYYNMVMECVEKYTGGYPYKQGIL